MLLSAGTTLGPYEARDRWPTWSPNGSRIAFDSNRRGHRDLYQKSSRGAGAEELLLESPQDKSAPEWSADGRFMLYWTIDPQTGYDLLEARGEEMTLRRAFATPPDILRRIGRKSRLTSSRRRRARPDRRRECAARR